MTHPMLYGVSLLIYLCGQLLPGESQTITVNPIGDWTEGEAATLTCTIAPYPGQMRWILASTDVASCNPDTCDQISTGDGAYVFGFDTTNHIFRWTINPVKKSNNGNIFKCSDGTSTANFTATVKERETTATTTAEQSNSDLSKAALALSIILPICVLAGLILFLCCCKSSRGSDADAMKLASQPWKSELDKLIDNEIKNGLAHLKLETQNTAKLKADRDHRDVKLANQPWKRELDTLIDSKIAKGLAHLKQDTKETLQRMVNMTLNNGEFLEMSMVKSLNEQRKADDNLFDPETALAGEDGEEL